MTTTELITMIANSGGTLGLAIFAIWMLNKVWNDRLKAEKNHNQAIYLMYQEVLKALDSNTKAIQNFESCLDVVTSTTDKVRDLLGEVSRQ